MEFQNTLSNRPSPETVSKKKAFYSNGEVFFFLTYFLIGEAELDQLSSRNSSILLKCLALFVTSVASVVKAHAAIKKQHRRLSCLVSPGKLWVFRNGRKFEHSTQSPINLQSRY